MVGLNLGLEMVKMDQVGWRVGKRKTDVVHLAKEIEGW